MNFKPKSREQKLVDTLYAFFGDMAEKKGQTQPLIVARHLLKLNQSVLSDPWLRPFLVSWDAEHPEEELLLPIELLWALSSFERNIAGQIAAIEKGLRQSNSPRARLRLIQGGLSENPDIPYVNPLLATEEYDF